MWWHATQVVIVG